MEDENVILPTRHSEPREEPHPPKEKEQTRNTDVVQTTTAGAEGEDGRRTEQGGEDAVQTAADPEQPGSGDSPGSIMSGQRMRPAPKTLEVEPSGGRAAQDREQLAQNKRPQGYKLTLQATEGRRDLSNYQAGGNSGPR